MLEDVHERCSAKKRRAISMARSIAFIVLVKPTVQKIIRRLSFDRVFSVDEAARSQIGALKDVDKIDVLRWLK